MKGEDVKRKIAGVGYSISEMARMLGTSQQNLSQSLSSQDVKTGLVEKIARALGVPVSYFFDSPPPSQAVAAGDFSAAAVNGDASVNADCQAVLKERVKSLQQLVDEKERMIEEKERTIKILLQK